MKIVEIIEYVRRRKRKLMWLSLAALLVLDLLDTIPLIVDKKHAHTSVEVMPAFWSLFGFIGCVLIIRISKWFGHAGIMQREDYYDD
jgi:hypothetical protein